MILALMWGMISWKDRIWLTMEYGAGLLVWGGLFNAVCSVFLSASLIFEFLLLKLGVTGASLYLNRQFENRDAVFFYINLGLNRRRMLAEVLAVDYLVWFAMVVMILLIR